MKKVNIGKEEPKKKGLNIFEELEDGELEDGELEDGELEDGELEDEKLSIFEELCVRNITYAVVVSQTTFKAGGAGISGRDYFIIAHQEDRKKLYRLRFYRFEDKIPVLERDLSNLEIEIFKGLSEDFIKVKHDENGRVYELKNDSFKEKYFPF